MVLNSIVWNVSPEIFSIGGISVRWYGLFFALSFYLGYLIMAKIFSKENMSQKSLDQLAMYMIISTVIGARLGHCLFYEPGYYLADPVKILKVWEGGLASHGAAIGIIVALILFSIRQHKPVLWILDRIVIVVALAGMFIRMGNLMNSEIYGIQTSLPWGFIFVRNGETVAKHPTQIYEALVCLILFLLLLYLYFRKPLAQKNGFLFSLFLIILFTSRFLIEFIKEPQVPFEEHMALNLGQWLSLPFIIGGVAILFISQIQKKKHI